MSALTHFDAQGQAHMVDVAAKAATHRIAIASGRIHALKRVAAHIVKNPALRKRDYSGAEYVYELTEADMGRAKSSPQTQAMSVYQWLIKYYVAAGIFHRDEIAIVIIED